MRARGFGAVLLGALPFAVFATALTFCAAPASAYTTPGGSGNLTLDSMGAPPSAIWKVSASPLVYQVNETLVVAAGDVLQIPAGTEIAFWNGTQLLVNGGLVVGGTAGAPVRMRVVPDSGGMAVSWQGVQGNGAAPFRLQWVAVNDSIDVTFSNGTGAEIRNTSYQGRLFIDNASNVAVSDISMEITPTDVGRPSLWIENAVNLSARGGNFHGGTGWGGAAVLVENSRAVRLDDLLVRDDNQNLIGLQILSSQAVTASNFTFTQGPTGGDPNEALDVEYSDGVWIERLVQTHVGGSGLGAVYGIRANATIANSTFPVGISQGVWQGPGRLTGLNATRLPVRPEAGGELWEFELVKVLAQWAAGGTVALGSASIANDSWNASSAVANGESGWMWALREVNASGAVMLSSAYTARVTCNCTAGQAGFTVVDGWGTEVAVQVGDGAPPVALAQVGVSKTGQAGPLDGSASFDNSAIAAFGWASLGPVNATGLPCTAPVCDVTFFEPGNFTLELTVTDTSGNRATRRVVASILDATAPQVSITGVTPARPGEDEPFTVNATATDNDPAFLPAVEWYIDGSRVIGDTLSPTLHVRAIGMHAVRLVVRDDAGNAGEANVTVEVRDSEAPILAVWAPPSGLSAPATVALNGSIASDNVAVVSYRWHVVGPGTDYNLTGERVNATLPAAGAYEVTLTVEDAEGNPASRTFSVQVAEAPHGGGFLPGSLAGGALAALAGAAAAAGLAAKRRRLR